MQDILTNQNSEIYMSIKAGLVGLPNVGKSTLFNALTKSCVPAENYPFCTIEPHVAITPVPDPRADQLQSIYLSEKIIPAYVTFVDIAGLVKGAAAGQGLGNQFLSHIREVDLLLHVLRCFEDPNVIREGGVIDPIADYEVIMAELMLKDLETITKRLEKLQKSIKAAAQKPAELKELQAELTLLTSAHRILDTGNYEKAKQLMAEQGVPTVPLLSTKNYLIIANISESELDGSYKQNPHYQALIKHFGQDRVIALSAKIEHELSQMDEEQAISMMEMLGIAEKSLKTVIRKSYEYLGLITFFTCGPKEIHAWPIARGTSARTAAGTIHSDLERGFICAEVFNYQDLINLGSTARIKEAGKIRREGQDYQVQDGDIILIKFNV